ncbi:MAG TPA: M50 family metallopeptidase [Terriglobales bacterium]|jgi:Zn-dependent protease
MSLLFVAVATLLAFAGHECGHYLTARWLGVQTYGFRFTRKGVGLAREFGSPVQNLSITIAGPLANFVLMGAIFFTPWLGLLAIWITLVNFIVGGFNLLPITGSDGMRALALLEDNRSWAMEGPRAEQKLSALGRFPPDA